jgi:hypothetical protein
MSTWKTVKQLLARMFRRRSVPPLDDPFAGRPVLVRPRPPGRSGAVAVAEPDDR